MYVFQVQLSTSGRWFYADYATFSIDSEYNNYTLRLSGYSGDAGDSLGLGHYGASFSTLDADNDRASSHHCAKDYQAGWWFNVCLHACLTCRYAEDFKWIYLSSWQSHGPIRAARMMIKSK